MKPSGRLNRTVGLARGGSLKRVRIRPVSDRREAERPARQAALEAVFDRDRTCRAGAAALEVLRSGVKVDDPRFEDWLIALSRACRVTPADGHEPLSRAQGGDPNNPDHVVAVCRSCHDDLHDHPNYARRISMTLRRAAPTERG